MADLDTHRDTLQRSRQSDGSGEAVAPDTTPDNPLLVMQQMLGNQAVQRHLRAGTPSPHMIAGLQRTLGNRAVQRLVQARGGRELAPTSEPEETDDLEAEEIAATTAVDGAASEGSPAASSLVGGKGASAEALKDPEETGGKSAGSVSTRHYRAAIDAFQEEQGGRSAGRELLGPTGEAEVEHHDHAPTLRRKGKGDAGGGVAPNLTKKTVSGPTSQKYGGFKWVVQWELDQPSPKGGIIVQKVEAVHTITSKDGTKLGTGFDKWTPYWEAWEVKKGKTVTTYAQGGDVEDDTFSKSPSPADSQGTFEEIGSAAFYEGLKIPSSMKANTKSPAGILPFSQADPGLSGGSTKLAHSLKATWDGVTKDGTTTVTTV